LPALDGSTRAVSFQDARALSRAATKSVGPFEESVTSAAMNATYCVPLPSMPTHWLPAQRRRQWGSACVCRAWGEGSNLELQERPPSVEPYTRRAQANAFWEAARRTSEFIGSIAIEASVCGAFARDRSS
jgi:hypothetical protein